MKLSSVLIVMALCCGAIAEFRVKYKSLGCYRDTSDRAIPIVEGQDDTLLDGEYREREDAVQKCALFAMERGFKVFSVQDGGQCGTSSTARQTYDKYGESDDCADDGKGGPWANDVYEVESTSFAEYKDLGCWADTFDRAIPTAEGTSGLLDGDYKERLNPIGKCARVTQNRMYSVFGVQDGGWCATSSTAQSTYRKYGVSDDCLNDGEGGPWANRVYERIPYIEYQSLGCYTDRAERAIPTAEGTSDLLDGPYKDRLLAIEKCAQVAKERGYEVFAVQDGGWCATAEDAQLTYGKYGRFSACLNDGKGGPWANEVYEIIPKVPEGKYVTLGCWKDTSDRVIPTAEGTTDLLDGEYHSRLNAIEKCARVAEEFGTEAFAVQDGGWCATSKDALETFDKYGPSTECKEDGAGGPWANEVYTTKRSLVRVIMEKIGGKERC